MDPLRAEDILGMIRSNRPKIYLRGETLHLTISKGIRNYFILQNQPNGIYIEPMYTPDEAIAFLQPRLDAFQVKLI